MTSPTGQLVSSVPLEPTPAEEESRKSISRSFKGTMASGTERKLLSVVHYIHLGVSIFFLSELSFFSSFSPPACEDVLTPAAVAETAMKVLKDCLTAMPAGKIDRNCQSITNLSSNLYIY